MFHLKMVVKVLSYYYNHSPLHLLPASLDTVDEEHSIVVYKRDRKMVSNGKIYFEAEINNQYN